MASYQYVYHMEGVSKTYPGGKKVFENIHLNFLPGVKIGVVGVNGAGKSTLLRVMAGWDKDFQGEAWAAKGATVGYLPQEPKLDDNLSVRENVKLGVAEKQAKLDRYNELAMNYSDETADEMASLQDQIDAENLWELDNQIDIAMEALRCPPDDATVATLSGGERRRVALCKLLLEEPDMLLLDEPTNHLDAETIAWLQKHLIAYKGTILTVTHDRYFLDEITSRGFSNWNAVAVCRTKATIPHGWRPRPSVWRRKPAKTNPSRRFLKRNLNGSAQAPKPVRPSPRPGSAPMKNWPMNWSRNWLAAPRSSSRTGRVWAARSSNSMASPKPWATSN